MRNKKYLSASAIAFVLAILCAVLIADIGMVNSRFLLPETTTPTAIVNHGQVYTKSDNIQYFQDGAGVEHPIISSDYAGIYTDGNAVATTINVVGAFEHVDVYDTDMPEQRSDGDNSTDSITVGDSADYKVNFYLYGSAGGNNKIYEFFSFEIAASGDTITGATQANPCVVTATGHSFSNGNIVKITGVAGMTELNDRLFTVANAGANDFELNDDDGAGINSGGFGVYSSGGTAVLATKLVQVHAERKYAVQNDVGSCSGGGFATLTQGNAIELYVKGETDATDITIEGSQFMIQRIK
jgi:hypothetical protein